MLQRKTSMKRSGFKKTNGKLGSGEGYKGPLRSKKGLNRRSAKKKDEDAAYSILRREFLMANPMCIVCGGAACDVHHSKFRGKHYLDVQSFMPVCRRDHQRIHEEKAWAIRNGYLIYR